MKKITIIWRFDKKENFWFLIPEDKIKYNVDFFVALRNSNNAWNGDMVEATEVKSRWKSREAIITKIIKKSINQNTWKNTDFSLSQRKRPEGSTLGVYPQGGLKNY